MYTYCIMQGKFMESKKKSFLCLLIPSDVIKMIMMDMYM